jgi:hypothetical protein
MTGTPAQRAALVGRLEDAYEDIIDIRAELDEVDALYHVIDTAAANLSEALLVSRALS